jgi:serine/arginine repetitive matrix protein 1
MVTGVDAKLLRSTKFPPEFNQKVDMQKVNLQVMKKYALRASLTSDICSIVLTCLLSQPRWIAGRISEILGNEDDVVIELCFNLIEGARFVSWKLLLDWTADLYMGHH